MSGIKVRVGHGASGNMPARNTVVELPFTEANPTTAMGAGPVVDQCRHLIRQLPAPVRDIVLANLLAEFGVRVR